MEDPSNEDVGKRFETTGMTTERKITRDYFEGDRLDANSVDELEERITRYPVGNSPMAGAVANYVNTIVGAAIIGLPFALAQSGLWAGIAMMCVAACLNGWTTYILIAAGEKMGRLNYEELMAELYGTAGTHAYCVFVGILTFGAMSVCLIVIGDTVPKILLAANVTAGPFTDREFVIALSGIIFVLPVSMLKDLSNLAYTSLTSIMAVGLLVLIVVFAGPGVASDNPEIDRSEVLTFMRPTIFAGFGAMSFAFVCQQSSFLVYRSMRDRELRRWAGVTRWSLSIAWLMSILLSVSGYLIFGTETQGNILNNFPTENIPASVARGLLAVTMVFSYPIDMYVARHVFDVSVFQTCLGMGPITSTRHYAITLALWAFTMTVACSTDNLGFVLDIFGALSSTVIGYIMPAVVHISCNREDLRSFNAVNRKGATEYDSLLGGQLWALHHLFLPVLVVVFGVIALVAGIVTTIWFQEETFTTLGSG